MYNAPEKYPDNIVYMKDNMNDRKRMGNLLGEPTYIGRCLDFIIIDKNTNGWRTSNPEEWSGRNDPPTISFEKI